MREIKFRAWDGKDKRWQRGASNLMIDMAGNQFWQFGYNINMLPKDDKWIVEQFTGLLDKNGKEIYEGDIVVSGGGDRNFKIAQHKSSYCLYVAKGNHVGWLDEQNLDELEVIGNIHESPELLEEPK